MKTITRLINKIKELLHTPLNNQKGIVLPIILMAIGGLSLIGAAAVSVTTGEIGIANNDKMYKASLNLAEAGIADANDGIQGNRNLVPQPIGAVTSASYSFNTALASGRYSVTIELPVVTTIAADSLMGASSVVVSSINNLGVGDTIIIGNTTIHMMAKIGSIDKGTNTLYLVDSQNRFYRLPYNATTSPVMYVAKNTIRITSTGQSGSGLTGGTLAAWRSIAPSAQTTTALPSGGVIRSTATLQADYAMQEIQLFDSFDAKVDIPGGKFNGPILVTGALDVQQYTKGDYSGPIFLSGPNATANFTPVGTTTSVPLPSTDSTFPKAVKIPLVTTTADTMIAQAENNATCYQKACSVADAKQQIYYLNGYQVDVKPYRPTTSGNGLKITLDDEPVLSSDGTKLTLTFVLNETFYINSSDNVTVSFSTNQNPSGNDLNGTNIAVQSSTVTYPNGGSTATDAQISLTTIDPASTTDAGTFNTSNQSFTNNRWYTRNTTITVTVLTNDLTVTGGYVRIYDNSNNATGLTTGDKQWSNGVWVTALGNVESQQKQGDINIYGDSGAGTHANHNTILTAEPTTYWRGTYADTNTSIASTAAWTSNGEGGVLFGGRTKGSAAWVVGDVAKYYTTYYIHTNAVGSCNDHDIKIVSYTKVTYLGTSTQCTDTERKRLFLYETIWNHTGTNTIDSGVQPDDADTKLGYIPHKGYFKWIRASGYTGGDANDIFKGIEVLMGDKEFNSVFNHSSDSRFTSAVINANIEKIRMIGWANPPLKFNSTTNRMDVYPVEFAASPAWRMPVNASGATSWDWPDMIGTRSQFASTSAKNGFDFSNFSTVMNSLNTTTGYIEAYQTSPGTYKLPDMSTINSKTSTTDNTGTGTINLYSTGTDPATIWPGAWGANGNKAMPGNPILDSSGLQTTVVTATISGPSFTTFEIKRGSANLFFDAANGIPFNIKELKIETKGAGATITMGSSTNPATVFAQELKLESEDCGGTINFNFTGKMVASEVEFENNVKYNIDTTITQGTCLSSGSNFIYLKKQSWREVRN